MLNIQWLASKLKGKKSIALPKCLKGKYLLEYKRQSIYYECRVSTRENLVLSMPVKTKERHSNRPDFDICQYYLGKNEMIWNEGFLFKKF